MQYLGEQLVDLAATRVGDQYILGSSVPKNNPSWHGPWDCAEFVSWVVFQITGKLYGCNNDNGNPAKVDAYTGYFGSDAKNIGKTIAVSDAVGIPGAIILRYPAPGGHVVVSDGKGGTVEAHSHNDGVIKSVVSGRRWDIGILIPWVTYLQNAPVSASPPSTIIYRLTDPFMRGDKVAEIQRKLTAAGFDTFGIDSIYGHNTAQAVLDYQNKNGLLPDGEVGPKTAASLGITV
jgi:hypothetical protein